MDPELSKAAEIAVKDVLKVKKDEKVLIITNPVGDVVEISSELYDAVLEAGRKACTNVSAGEEPDEFCCR